MTPQPVAQRGAAEPPSTCPAVLLVPIDELEPDPAQGRKRFDALEGLAASIRECGILEPILVTARGEGGKYRIVAGERRWRAAQIAKLEEVPCIVREGARPALDQLVENFQREDLDPVARGDQIRHTMAETGMSARDVAERAGLGVQTVLKYLRLADGPEIVRQAASVGLAVEGDATRVLEWTCALEALGIYTTVLEPADPSEKKGRALTRLERLVRRALAEGWTRARWRAYAAEVGKKPGPAGAMNSGRRGGNAARARPAAASSASAGLVQELDARLANAEPEVALAVAEVVDRAAAKLDAHALFAKRPGVLVVYVDRLAAGADANRRAELIRELDAVLAAARRRVAPQVTRVSGVHDL